MLRSRSGRIGYASLIVLCLIGGLLSLAHAEGIFEKTLGFATKTGYRGVFSWQATKQIDAVVHYGTNPEKLDQSIRQFPESTPDTAGLAIVDDLAIGSTYYWQVEDLLTGERSEVKSFQAVNAYEEWNGSTYTLDLLVQLDTQSLPPDVPHDLALENLAQGVSIFAERLYDALDGYARLGNVIITDTDLDYGANIPFEPVACFTGATNAADVLVQTSVPFDSHTFSGWAIEDPCTSFYVGRLGQLIVPWGDGSPEDLHFGYVSAHEMMHYAFNAPDLYDPADINDPRVGGCWNLEWDGSVMHNSGGWNPGASRWELTELDRNPSTTPCDHQHDPTWTWEELRGRYTNVPPANPDGPVGAGINHIIDTMARGNEDGGALNIQILDTTPGFSRLTSFTPHDAQQAITGLASLNCADSGSPVIADREGDANDAFVAGGGINETALDIRYGSMETMGTNPGSVDGLAFIIGVTDLAHQNPQSAPNISYNFNFHYEGGHYYVEAARTEGGTEIYEFGAFAGTPGIDPRVHEIKLSGVFDWEANRIVIVVKNEQLASSGAKPFAAGDLLTDLDIVSRRAVPTDVTTSGPSADDTEGSCAFRAGSGTTLPPAPALPPPPSANGGIALGSAPYSWSAGPFTRVATTGLILGDACSGIEGDHCDYEYVWVDVPGGGATLEVTVSSGDPTADFDLFVFGPDGKLVDDSAREFTPETVSKHITQSGLYTIAVDPFATVNASYHGSALLKTTESAPLPVSSHLDGQVSIGGTHQGEGDPPVDLNPLLICPVISDVPCDIERVSPD